MVKHNKNHFKNCPHAIISYRCLEGCRCSIKLDKYIDDIACIKPDDYNKCRIFRVNKKVQLSNLNVFLSRKPTMVKK